MTRRDGITLVNGHFLLLVSKLLHYGVRRRRRVSDVTASYTLPQCQEILELPTSTWDSILARRAETPGMVHSPCTPQGQGALPPHGEQLMIRQPSMVSNTSSDPDMERKCKSALRALRRARAELKTLKRKRADSADDGPRKRVLMVADDDGGRPDYASRLALARGRAGRMLPSGMLALAFRKCLGGYVSSKDVAGVLVDPRIHRWSVVSAELRLHASIVASTIQAHKVQLNFITRKMEDSWQVGCFTLQGDATNSNIYMNSKLHVLRIRSFYRSCVGTNIVDVHNDLMADPQVVDGCTAEHTMAMYKNAMKGCGAPTWSTYIDRVNAGDSDAAMVDAAYILNTDAGPDQIRFRKLACMEAEACQFITMWPINCFKHQGHRMVVNGIQVVESYMQGRFGYFSSLTKIVQCWRTDQRKFFLMWRKTFGDSSAINQSKFLPPRCLAGRWGSITACEDFLINIGGVGHVGKVGGYNNKSNQRIDESLNKTSMSNKSNRRINESINKTSMSNKYYSQLGRCASVDQT